MTTHTKGKRPASSNTWILCVLMGACCIIATFIVYPATTALTGDAFMAVVATVVIAAILCIVVWQIWIQLDRFKGNKPDEEQAVQSNDIPAIEIHNHNVNVNTVHNRTDVDVIAVANAKAASQSIADRPVNVKIDNHIHSAPDTKTEPNADPTAEPSETELRHSEAYRIWKVVDGLDSDLVSRLPVELKDKNALFALVMLRDAGFLDDGFMPVAEPGQKEIHRTNYSFIAAALGRALELSNHWQVFQKAWGIKNMRQLYEKIKKPDLSAATPFEIDVVNVLREARTLNPKLATTDLHYFINKCPADFR